MMVKMLNKINMGNGKRVHIINMKKCNRIPMVPMVDSYIIMDSTLKIPTPITLHYAHKNRVYPY